MSKETKALIKHLEHERERISEFLEEIDLQVEHGAVTRELGDQLIALEFEGRDPRTHLTIINRQLAELRALEANAVQSSSRLDAAAPIAIVAVLAIAIVWNFGAITGLFTAGQETFYAIPLDQTIAGTQTIPLTISTPLTSLRVDGTIEGTGTARIELVKDGVPYLVHSFTSDTGTGLLTGFVIDDGAAPVDETSTDETVTETSEETDENNVGEPSSEPGNETSGNETQPLPGTEPVNGTEEPVVEEPAPEEPVAEQPETEEPITEQEPDEPIVLEPTTEEPEAQEPVQANPPRTETLDAACVETCSLPRIEAPFSLRVTTTGDVTVQLDTILYGTSEEPLPEEEPPVTTPVTPEPVNENVTPVEPSNQTPITPAEPAEPLTGVTCTTDADCNGGACIDDRYQGTTSAKYCAPTRGDWCVADDTVYPAGTTLDDSACMAGTGVDGQPDATWLVTAGRGRFAIQAADGELAAAVDKYGTMVVSGSATFGTPAADAGWLVTDAEGTPRLSIGDDGTLRSEGSILTRTTPTRTGNGDFVIATSGGPDAAVITQTGAVLLAGDLVHSANFG